MGTVGREGINIDLIQGLDDFSIFLVIGSLVSVEQRYDVFSGGCNDIGGELFFFLLEEGHEVFPVVGFKDSDSYLKVLVMDRCSFSIRSHCVASLNEETPSEDSSDQIGHLAKHHHS